MKQRDRERKETEEIKTTLEKPTNKMSRAKATIRNIVDKLEKVIQHYIEKKTFFWVKDKNDERHKRQTKVIQQANLVWDKRPKNIQRHTKTKALI